MTARTPSSFGPFAAQSRDEPEPYSLPARTTSGTPLGLVLHRRRRRSIIALAVGQVARDAALGAGRELVPQAHVGERAAHHHLVVAAPRAVGVEVRRRRRRARSGTCPPGRLFLIEPAGEMWSVVMLSPSTREHARARDVGDGAAARGHALEVRRVLHVRRLRVPRVEVARRAPSSVLPAARRRRRPRRRRFGTSRGRRDSSIAVCDLARASARCP